MKQLEAVAKLRQKMHNQIDSIVDIMTEAFLGATKPKELEKVSDDILFNMTLKMSMDKWISLYKSTADTFANNMHDEKFMHEVAQQWEKLQEEK